MNQPQLRVLVIDDSAHNRRVIADIIESGGLAKVVGLARDGEEGLKKAFELKPDVVTLDLEMPKMDGFVFLRILMKSLPTPVIVVSSLREDKNVFRALEMGALDFVAKPDSFNSQITEFQAELLGKLQMITHVRMRNIQRSLSHRGVEELSLGRAQIYRASRDEPEHKIELIAIGSSTGGPSAVQTIISQLPQDLDSAVVVSQHMPAGFTRAFAERLDRNSRIRVKEAEDGDEVKKGTALIAPGGKNLIISNDKDKVIVLCQEKEKKDRYVPSVDKLFISAVNVYKERTMGVVLTGMGSDGKNGVIAIKEKGGIVIVESEQTSVVFGMPKEVIQTGMVDKVLNLEDIAREILRYC